MSVPLSTSKHLQVEFIKEQGFFGEAALEKSIIRVLVVDDYDPWRRHIRAMLKERAEFLVIGEVSDGLSAAEKTQELQPDLILLDVGLPGLNGIQVARRILERVPQAKILFVSENRSWEIAEEALRTGAMGYIVKSDTNTELVPAMNAVFHGRQFIGARFGGHNRTNPTVLSIPRPSQADKMITPVQRGNGDTLHEVAFYPNDQSLLEGFARFIKASLKMGYAVILLVTESHRVAIFQRLWTDGLNVDAVLDEGRLAPLDVADTLPKLMLEGEPDPVLCGKVVGDLVRKLGKGANGKRARVVACGECAPTLLAEGKAEAAIQFEHLWDEVAKLYQIDTLCGYSSSRFPIAETEPIFHRICAEHSAVHVGSRES